MKKVMAMFLSLLLVLSIPVAAVFASQTPQVTKSFKYRFVNKNPFIGSSSAQSHIDSIDGTYGNTRDCLVIVLVTNKDGTYSGTTVRIQNRISTGRLTASRTSDSKKQVTSMHWATVDDGIAGPLGVSITRTTRGTTSGTRSNPNW